MYWYIASTESILSHAEHAWCLGVLLQCTIILNLSGVRIQKCLFGNTAASIDHKDVPPVCIVMRILCAQLTVWPAISNVGHLALLICRRHLDLRSQSHILKKKSLQLKSCHTCHFLWQVQLYSKWSTHVYCILLASFRLGTSHLTCA